MYIITLRQDYLIIAEKISMDKYGLGKINEMKYLFNSVPALRSCIRVGIYLYTIYTLAEEYIMYNTYIENWEGRLTHQPTSLPWWKRNIFSPISSLFIYQVFVDCFSLSSSLLPFIISSSVPILKQCFPNKVFTFSYEHFSHVSSLLISAWIYLTSVFFFS